MSGTEHNKRYLAYLSALALTVAPVVIAPPASAAASAGAYADLAASVTPEKLARMAATPDGVFTECVAEWAQCSV